MTLLPLDTSERLDLAAAWLGQKENYQWLDFGGGRQLITPAVLRIMTQREAHFLRLYTSDEGAVPIGILGLSNVDLNFGTGMFWAIAGDKSFRMRGFATFASSRFLSLAFRELQLHAISTWAVENNPSLRGIRRLRFRYIGRQRQCHCLDGRRYDRLHFDLLASEHRELGPQALRAGREPEPA
jgi:RimJ/RimL family protein N-acetyltransferase